jgi:hypothetical protein
MNNMVSGLGLRILCCNAFKNIHNKCKCVDSCKNFEQKCQLHEFKCELTNKMKKVGNIDNDCDCENQCIVKKSEIKIIEDYDMSNK